MKAVVFHGKEDLRVEDIPVPKIKPGHVKVKPRFCGICGTDLHEYLGGCNLVPDYGQPHALTGETVPLTFGHEFSGVVEEVGEGVKDYKTGDRVCIFPVIFDNECPACQEGLFNCCTKGGFIGLSGWGGGLSEHIVVPESSVLKLPENVSFEIGALIEPLAVGWHAVRSSPFKEGSGTALVFGGGPIGLAVIQALKALGASKIIVSEMANQRKVFAKQMGATDILDPTKDDVVAECKKLTGGLGPDVAFDAAGVQATLDTAFDAIRPRGMVVNIAIWEKDAVLHPTRVLLKEKKYQGIVTYSRQDYVEVLEAIAQDKMRPAGMITKTIAMDAILEEGFKALIDDKENQVKILVDCHKI